MKDQWTVDLTPDAPEGMFWPFGFNPEPSDADSECEHARINDAKAEGARPRRLAQVA